MSAKPAFVAVRSPDGEGRSTVERALRGCGRTVELRMDAQKFTLGSLDAMLNALDRLARTEQMCEGFLKRAEKLNAELAPDRALSSLKLDSKEFGSVSVEKFLAGFAWDDLRFPRGSALVEQIRCFEEKVEGLERALKEKQTSYHATRAEAAAGDHQGANSSPVASSASDIVFELMARGGSEVRPDLFVKSGFLCSVLVLVPRQRLPDFQSRYESCHDLVVPASLTLLGELQDFAVGHLVAFERALPALTAALAEQFAAVAKRLDFDREEAEAVQARRQGLQSKVSVDRDLLLSACAEAFKETLVTLVHVKVLRVIVDGRLRFGPLNEVALLLLVFDKGREERALQSLIRAFAEPDKLEFYGTKEQLNDSEDFFPFVYAAFQLTL